MMSARAGLDTVINQCTVIAFGLERPRKRGITSTAQLGNEHGHALDGIISIAERIPVGDIRLCCATPGAGAGPNDMMTAVGGCPGVTPTAPGRRKARGLQRR